MAVCAKCGAELAPGQRFCQQCGTRAEEEPVLKMPVVEEAPVPAPVLAVQPTVEETPAPVPAAQPEVAAAPAPDRAAAVPQPREVTETLQPRGRKAPPPPDPDEPTGKYAPISTKGYIGVLLLMSVPVVGWVIMLVWALGGCRKVAKRNLARAWAVIMLVSVVLLAIAGFAGKIYLDKYLSVNGYPSVNEMFHQGFDGDTGFAA